MSKPLVSDGLWALIAPLFPPEPPEPRGGRPRRISDRAALTDILFVLKSGIPWEMLPQEMGCGSGMTCWRRLRDWQQASAWQRLLARCQSSARCAAAFPQLEADFAAVTTRLSKEPLATTVVDPATGGLVRLDLRTFMGMLISTYLASAQGSVAFPKDLHAAASGDWSGVLQVLARTVSGPSTIPIMSITIRCSDAWASLGPTRVASVAPGSPFMAYEMDFARGMNMVCKYWPQATGASGSVTSSAPIVFLNGTTDPVDPQDNVAQAHKTTPNSLGAGGGNRPLAARLRSDRLPNRANKCVPRAGKAIHTRGMGLRAINTFA